MGRRRLLWLGIVALALGVAVVLYRGPGRGVVRGYVGDVAATMLVYAALGLVWRARLATLAIVTLAIAAAIEVGQTAWHATSTAGALILGTTFDPLDLVAYALGVAVSVAWTTSGVSGRHTADVENADVPSRARECTAEGGRPGPKRGRARASGC